MNYRHSYHAGNFADVFKHILLTRILSYLNLKVTPYFYLDTHAGIGLYDLAAKEALRTNESADGVIRILSSNIPSEIGYLLEPYLNVLDRMRSGNKTLYPGSPLLAQQLMRDTDRLLFCELHKDDVRLLDFNCGHDGRSRILNINGLTALNAYLPPKERRGLVLVDPPFEQPSEFENLAKALSVAYKKWATGVYAVWYPVKGLHKVNSFINALKDTGIAKIMCLELLIDNPADETILSGCGMIIINPPWVLENEAQTLLPFLTKVLQREDRGSWQIKWLTEK